MQIQKHAMKQKVAYCMIMYTNSPEENHKNIKTVKLSVISRVRSRKDEERKHRGQ